MFVYMCTIDRLQNGPCVGGRLLVLPQIVGRKRITIDNMKINRQIFMYNCDQ